MKTKVCARAALAALLAAGIIAGQAAAEDAPADKLALTIDFSGAALAADSEGRVNSFTDAGFGDGDSTVGVAYSGEWFGGSALLKFGSANSQLLETSIGWLNEMPVDVDELYAWIKPFGEMFTFTGGIFSDSSGVSDYTDDIDDFGMGAFFLGEDGEPFTDPSASIYLGPTLDTGFMAAGAFGPVTVQALFGPAYSKESATEFANGVLDVLGLGSGTIDAESAFFRYGARVTADAGIGTFSVLYKITQYPMDILNTLALAEAEDLSAPWYPGARANMHTFGAYADITAAEGLGLSLGYTGFLIANDDADTDAELWNGIDLRAQWTGIEGLSVSTHHNASFARGPDRDWYGLLPGPDSTFFSLYNALGATKTLTDRFSINAELANILVKYDNGEKTFYDLFWAEAKLITAVQTAEFSAGLRLDAESTGASGADNTVITFSIPVGIKVTL